MPARRTIGILAVSVVAASISLIAVGQQRQSNPINEHPRYKKWPITDFFKPAPADPETRRARKARGDRFNLLNKNDDPRRFAITEDRESTFGSADFHSPPEPAFPVNQSDAIVVADVKIAEAFLSTDQTGIYSEFSLATIDVLQNTSSLPLARGTMLTAVRGGGGVRFPSGKVILRGNNAQPLPEIGSKYLFFLKQQDGENYFDLITAYELRDGKVYPLDGRTPRGWVFPQYAEHQKLAGIDETAFLYFVRQAVHNGSNPGRGK